MAQLREFKVGVTGEISSSASTSIITLAYSRIAPQING